MIQATWRSSPSSSTFSLRTGTESTRNPSSRANMEQMLWQDYTAWGFTHLHIHFLTIVHQLSYSCQISASQGLDEFRWDVKMLSFHSPGSTRDVYWGVPECSAEELPQRLWPEEDAVCHRRTHLELRWLHDYTRYIITCGTLIMGSVLATDHQYSKQISIQRLTTASDSNFSPVAPVAVAVFLIWGFWNTETLT